MTNYLEEIMKRSESKIPTDKESIIDFLTKDRKGNTVRRKTRQIEQIAGGIEILKTEKIETLKEGREIMERAERISVDFDGGESNRTVTEHAKKLLNSISKSQIRREEALTTPIGEQKEFLKRSAFRSSKSFAQFFYLSETEARNRLGTLGIRLDEIGRFGTGDIP